MSDEKCWYFSNTSNNKTFFFYVKKLHFSSDIKSYSDTVTAFEIGSHTGFINTAQASPVLQKGYQAKTFQEQHFIHICTELLLSL